METLQAFACCLKLFTRFYTVYEKFNRHDNVNSATSRWRYILQDEDHSENEPRLLSGFLCYSSRMLLERYQIVSNLLIQNKFLWFGQSTQNSVLCRTEILRQFLRHSVLYFLWHLSDIILLNLKSRGVSRLVVQKVFFLILSSNGCQLFLVPQCCRLERKSQTVLRTEIRFHFQF